ncbi:MAG: hypothetical protein PHE50_06415 [Dehalococcoidales bacterium]|nr:hypothetical protein [Dehalococcoidales bacterium]
MLTLIGLILILLSAVGEAFCNFGRAAMPQYKPGILKTPFRWVFEVLWVLLLLGGGIALLLDAMVSGLWLLVVITIVVFWLLLPLLFNTIMQKRFLPHWEEVKRELAPKGLNENNYWRDDWWKLEEKRRKKKQKPAM